jgi:hypothetical protein
MFYIETKTRYITFTGLYSVYGLLVCYRGQLFTVELKQKSKIFKKKQLTAKEAE